MAHYHYNPYYPLPQLWPPPFHYRSHSHGHSDNTTNVFVPASPARASELQRIADEIHGLRISSSRGRHRAHSDQGYPRSRSRSYEEWKKDIIARHENEQAAKKRKQDEELKRLRKQLLVDEILAKEEEERKYKEFEALQEKRRAEAKLKAKKEKEKADEAARAILRKANLRDQEIDRIMARAAASSGTSSAGDLILFGGSRTPTYVKTKKRHISTEVLRENNLRYRYDPDDSDYIIILHEMDQSLFEALHARTMELRAKQNKRPLLLGLKKDDKGRLEMVKQKPGWSRGRSKRKSSDGPVVI